jgi:hypothetical protein
VSKTHDAWFGAGLVFCRKCGFIAAGGRKNLGIFEPCRWSTEGVQIPEGSKYRRSRSIQGKHPDCTAKKWPDGRSSKVKVRMEQVKWQPNQQIKEVSSEVEEVVEGESTEEERLQDDRRERARRRKEKEDSIKSLVGKVREQTLSVIRRRIRQAAKEAFEKGTLGRRWFRDLDLSPEALAACLTTEMQSDWWEEWSEALMERRLDIEVAIADLAADLCEGKAPFRRMRKKQRQQS